MDRSSLTHSRLPSSYRLDSMGLMHIHALSPGVYLLLICVLRDTEVWAWCLSLGSVFNTHGEAREADSPFNINY